MIDRGVAGHGSTKIEPDTREVGFVERTLTLGGGRFGVVGGEGEGLGESSSNLISISFSIPTLGTTEPTPLLTVPTLAPFPANCWVAFVRLGGSLSPCPPSPVVQRPNLCLQLPGRIFWAVQKRIVLTNPCSRNADEVKMVTGKGTDSPESVANREAA